MNPHSFQVALVRTAVSLKRVYDALRQLVLTENPSIRAIEAISAGIDRLCSTAGNHGGGTKDQVSEAVTSLRADVVALRRQHDIVEPFDHVEEVERLRQRNRPRQVKLLLIAESHVRVSDDQFARRGAGFLYEPRYTTRWWYDLILPGFGSPLKGRLTPTLKERLLERMRTAGFWVLDASVLSLSGYEKLGLAESRPFSKEPYSKTLEGEILDLSWHRYVHSTFCSLMSDPNPPVLAVYRRVSHLLPLEFRPQAEPCLVFPPRTDQARYRQSTFVGGTETFKQKAASAGLHACLSE